MRPVKMTQSLSFSALIITPTKMKDKIYKNISMAWKEACMFSL